MSERRTIKRYTNRKLYDKQESRYVTLEEIARLVRAGEDIQVIDNETEEDLTSVTFAQIILEEEKRKQNLLSVPFLRKLIRTGEARVQDISDRASRSIEAIGDFTGKAGERVREAVVGAPSRAIEESLSRLDELFALPQKRLAQLGDAAREQIDRIRGNPTVQRELERIASSLHTLEEAVAKMTDESADSGSASRSAGESRETPAAATTSLGNGNSPPVDRSADTDTTVTPPTDKPEHDI